jgi:hypothetical protein
MKNPEKSVNSCTVKNFLASELERPNFRSVNPYFWQDVDGY